MRTTHLRRLTLFVLSPLAAVVVAAAVTEPTLLSWVPAAFPPGIPAEIRAGSVEMRLVLSEKGEMTSAEVVQASHPALAASAIAAVNQWKFGAAIDDGEPVPSCVELALRIDRNDADRPATYRPALLPVARTAPQTKDTPLREYPASLTGRGLSGRVLFRCRVLPDGTAAKLQILHASHPDFVVPVYESSPEWRFTPGKHGDLVVSSELLGEAYYVDPRTPTRAAVLAANHISAPDGTEPESCPELIAVVDPVHPFEHLMAGTAGSAAVEFVVDGRGRVRDIKVREATRPEFGAALAAAVETWIFRGAMSRGRSVDVPLLARADFPLITADASEGAEVLSRLVAGVRTDSIGSGKGLDAKLTPIYRVAPVAPGNSDAKGEVVVEFVVDREGRVRLPRATRSPNEALSWSAVTAVSQWVFKAPTRVGRPTDVKVQVPIGF